MEERIKVLVKRSTLVVKVVVISGMAGGNMGKGLNFFPILLWRVECCFQTESKRNVHYTVKKEEKVAQIKFDYLP